MTTKFNPLAKKGFDKIGMSEAEVSAAHLKLDQTTPQTIVNDIPLLTGLTPSSDYHIATKKYIDDLVSGLAGGHDAVTLDANADTILSLSAQELGLDAQTANRIWAGPVSGAAAVPTFRALVADDIPDLSGTYLTAETDPDFAAWLLATPPLYPGGWYDADQNTINLSGFNNDSGFITSYTDEKVKYDAGDATAGYIADKIIAGTGISVAEGTGANENKLVVTSDITQYTDSDAIAAIQGDASWNASDWDTAFGWGNHALAGYVTGTPWTSEGYLTSLAGAVLTDQTVGQTIGLTGARLTKLWATDIACTNAIDGSVTGNAGTVTNATLTTALTVNTGAVTLTGNVAGSVLTIGAGAVSVSGSNTGDQVTPDNEAGSANNFLTAYNSATGAWTKAQPTWANIDKTTSDIADITTKSHTSLTDIGTNTHAQIDTHLGLTNEHIDWTNASSNFVTTGDVTAKEILATAAATTKVTAKSTTSSSYSMFALATDNHPTLAAYMLAYGSTHASANELAFKNQYGDIVFYPGDSGSSSEKVRITSTGRLGVGIAPSSQVDIIGNDLAISSASADATNKYGRITSRHRTNSQANVLCFMSGSDTTDNFVRIGGGASDYNAITQFRVYTAANTTTKTGTERLRITSKGNVTIGSAALATNATDGFLYIPSCAGTPTGTPTAYSGRVAMVFDTTNNKLYVYDGSWIDVT